MDIDLTFIQLQSAFSVHFLSSLILCKKRSRLKDLDPEGHMLDLDIYSSADLMAEIVTSMIEGVDRGEIS
jgi:hypothetical protein